MLAESHQSLDQKTIDRLGLRQATRKINAQIAPEATIFEFSELENVFLMENDLYGNPMPEGSLFLAFEGRSGLVGKHIRTDTLHRSSIEEIRQMAEDNSAG